MCFKKKKKLNIVFLNVCNILSIKCSLKWFINRMDEQGATYRVAVKVAFVEDSPIPIPKEDIGTTLVL